MKDLKPCSCCGIKRKIKVIEDDMFYIQCMKCGLRTDFYICESDAIAAWNTRADSGLVTEAMKAQIIEYESRGQVLYAGLGAPSSIRLVYDLLGKEKPADLPPIEDKHTSELVAALKEYGEHLDTCSSRWSVHSPEWHPCDCGFDEALALHETEVKP